MFESNILYKIH